MEAKLKAIQLVDKFYEFNHIGNSHAKKCALIAVDEIIKTFIPKNKEKYSCEEIVYWQEVKTEIEKL